MKKVLFSLFALFLIIPSVSFANSNTYEGDNSNSPSQSYEEVKQRFIEILENYDVNEPFSDGDSTFIKENLDKIQQLEGAFAAPAEGTISIMETDTLTFQGSDSDYAITGTIQVSSSLGKNTAKYLMTAWDQHNRIRTIEAQIKWEAIGIINLDTGELGKVYTNTVSQKGTGKSYLDMQKTDGFTGLPIVSYFYPKASFDGDEIIGEFN